MNLPDNADIKEINAVLALGQCHFQRVLGSGSYGIVLQAKHKVTDNDYAVKMITMDLSDERIKYQKRELDLLTKLELSHRYTIQYFNSWAYVVDNKKTVCIQMELCWLSLQDYVFKNDLYVPPTAIVKNERFYKHIFPQILNGLDAIHSVGWVHRDIHPGNILIANPKPSGIQDIVVKIADFGLARHIGSSASLTVKAKLGELSPHVGHWLYRAPELSTPYYDYKVDLYSAGIVLYLLCRYVEDICQWKPEITALIADPGRKLNDLSDHKDEMLFKLLSCLLERKPDDRRSACEALDMCPRNETDGPNSSRPCFYFLTRKEGEDAYNRCCASNDSLFGIKVAVENATGIKRENQVLIQESIVNGLISTIYLNSDINVGEMILSAKNGNKQVTLVVSEGKIAPLTHGQEHMDIT